MNITYAKIDQILKTLPIGYYCGYNIKVILSKENDSYFNFVENEIVISSTMIQDALLAQTDENKAEQYIRTLLYHEISHALITPRKLFDNLDSEQKQIINIFEDERIETILKDNFINVDFKEFLFNVTNVDQVINSNDSMNKFYSIVRYRKGEKKFVDLVDKIIKAHQTISYDDNEFFRITSYRKHILKLYELIKNHEDKLKAQQTSIDNSNIIDQQIEEASQKSNDVTQSINSDEFDFEENDKINKLNKSLDIITTVKTQDLKQTTLKQLVEKYDSKYNTDSIIDSIKHQLRKSGLNGHAIASYSGRFNYRLIQNNDYKYFTVQSSNSSYRQYQKFHLNLFIDNSCSFSCNRNIVNQILKILSKYESENQNFSFDLITINTQIKEYDKKNRYIDKCTNSNSLTKDIYEIVRKHQQAQATVYNIVLFDGDACCEPTYNESLKEQAKNFKAFDSSNFTIISDESNKKYLKKIKQARVILTYRYTEKLINNLANVIKTI